MTSKEIENVDNVGNVDAANNDIDIEYIDEKVDAASPRGNRKSSKFARNPAKLVIGGLSEGTKVVRGGIANVEKGVTTVGGHLGKVPGVSHGVSFFSDYRRFLDRGNVIDLAVAVVVGAAFTAIVTSLVADIITPLLALASGKSFEENFIILRYNETGIHTDPPTREEAKKLNYVTWNWGNFLQTVINFFIVTACVFILVKLYQMGRRNATETTEKKCDVCLKDIPIEAVRCCYCTSWLDFDACAKMEILRQSAMAAATAAANVTANATGAGYFQPPPGNPDDAYSTSQQLPQSSLARF
ncbi:hypothetical protein DFQ27_007248 [Actinomortierella ambigua]|uniref:Large-conductance mechanosensitive channel n=1 Tax=Actinomortierella ambigua TaxID=1343610 RepID=A0A9P6PU77_9FUNG|nr:hypothetical protein DFQ27_007248 [Actinomortierella ambigua]